MTSCSACLGPRSNGPRGPPAVLCASGPGPGTRGVDQISGDWGLGPKALGILQVSRATRAHVQGPSGTTSCTGRLVLGFGGLRVRPALPGE